MENNVEMLEKQENTDVVEVVITVDDIRKAKERLEKYKKGKSSLETRIVANEQWWKLRQWDYIKENEDKTYNYNHSDKDPFEVATPWLWNCVV